MGRFFDGNRRRLHLGEGLLQGTAQHEQDLKSASWQEWRDAGTCFQQLDQRTRATALHNPDTVRQILALNTSGCGDDRWRRLQEKEVTTRGLTEAVGAKVLLSWSGLSRQVQSLPPEAAEAGA